MESSLILDRNQVDFILSELSGKGLVVLDRLVPLSLIKEWNTFFSEKQTRGHFKTASIGLERKKAQKLEIRSDQTFWLSHEPEFKDFWALTQQLGDCFKSELYLSIKSSEFHLACYGPGQLYQKHFDRHQNSNHRQISLICYLNPTWSPDWGGELCIYSQQNEDLLLQRVSPYPGTLVLFRSELFPHEVKPALYERRSLTGWFRDDDPLLVR
jgi:SM-20-related protein